MKLTFNALRAANLHRLPTFKNSKGELTHDATGSNWTPAQWLQALTGELGEYANVRKKFERGDITEAEFNDLAANELADIQIYLDLLAHRININLAEATVYKFNVKSREVGSPILITGNGSVINETRPGTMSGEVLYAPVIGEEGYIEQIEKLAEERADRNYKLRCEIMELQKKIAGKNAEIEKLQNDRAERNKEIDELEKSFIKHLTVINLVDADHYNQTLEENKRLKEQVKALAEVNTTIHKSRISDQAAIKGLNEQVSALTRSKEAYKRDFDSLATNTRNVYIENSELKDKLKAISKITDQEEQQIEIKIGVPDSECISRIRRTDGGCNHSGNLFGGFGL